MKRRLTPKEKNDLAHLAVKWAENNNRFESLAANTGYARSVLMKIFETKANFGLSRSESVIKAAQNLGWKHPENTGNN